MTVLRFTCPKCHSKYKVQLAKLLDKIIHAKCKKCGETTKIAPNIKDNNSICYKSFSIKDRVLCEMAVALA